MWYVIYSHQRGGRGDKFVLVNTHTTQQHALKHPGHPRPPSPPYQSSLLLTCRRVNLKYRLASINGHKENPPKAHHQARAESAQARTPSGRQGEGGEEVVDAVVGGRRAEAGEGSLDYGELPAFVEAR